MPLLLEWTHNNSHPVAVAAAAFSASNYGAAAAIFGFPIHQSTTTKYELYDA